MVISHKYQYLFIELPRTGTTAIAKELVQNYGGERILNKHAHYDDFLKQATEKEKKYLTFSCIRNPLERAATRYYKLKTGYQNPIKDIKRFKRQNRRVRLQTYYLAHQYKYIQKRNASFSQYLLKYHFFPYDDWSLKHHKQFDFIIRFENLEEDFYKVLYLLNIEPVRPLPHHNKSPQKTKSYDKLIDSWQAIKRIKKVFGPYLLKWGYTLPEEWGDIKISYSTKIELKILNYFRKLYWKYFK